MPGFTLIYQHEGLDKGISERTERLVRSSFKLQFITRTNELMILFRDGNHYPYEIYETKEYILLVEGKIYGLTALKDKEFLSKVDDLFRQYQSGDYEEQLNYFHNLDGEFILYLIDRNGDRILVVNDLLGRLPQYYRSGKQFILSRDIYVLDKVTTGIFFDDSSVYQFLRLGFPLGQSTLFHDVTRLPYSSCVSIAGEEIDIGHTPLLVEEMEGKSDYDKPEVPLYELFQKAMADRFADEGPFIVSLSGGLDSRVIMGEAEKKAYPVEYASFVYENPIINNDLTISRELGKHYNRSPQLIELKEYMPESFDELTMVKGGMNYLGMAFLVSYLMQLGHNYKLMMTGDGGDKTLPYLFPERKVKTKDFASYVLRKHGISSRKSLDSFLLSDVKEEEARVVDYLNEIEGSNTLYKYKNFLLFERSMNWLREGEDRNRNYLWSTTPYFQPAFFKLAHSLPEKDKKNFKLFREFTKMVDPNLNSINNANWGIPLGNQKAVEKMFYRQRIKSRLPRPFFRGVAHLEAHDLMAQYVASLMHKGFGGQLSVYADQHDLRAASSETLFHLITLLKVSEMSWRQI